MSTPRSFARRLAAEPLEDRRNPGALAVDDTISVPVGQSFLSDSAVWVANDEPHGEVFANGSVSVTVNGTGPQPDVETTVVDDGTGIRTAIRLTIPVGFVGTVLADYGIQNGNTGQTDTGTITFVPQTSPPPPPAAGVVALAANFPGDTGLWRWTPAGGWAQLAGVAASSGLSVDAAGSVFGAFDFGMWRWTAAAGWSELTNLVPENFRVTADGDLFADFGTFAGLWRWTAAGGWSQLTTSDPQLLTASDDGSAVAVFPFGTWRWSAASGWAELTTQIPTRMTTADGGTLFGVFASGTWRWTPAAGWSQLTPLLADGFDATDDGTLAGDFGANGLWRWTSAAGWTQLSGFDPLRLAADAAGGLYADLGSGPGRGIWRFTPAGGFVQLTLEGDSEALSVTADGSVFIDYESTIGGVWRFAPGSGFAQLTPLNAAFIASRP